MIHRPRQEVWKFLDFKMHRDADVEDSAQMQRNDIIENLLPTENNSSDVASYASCVSDALRSERMRKHIIHTSQGRTSSYDTLWTTNSC